MLLKQEELNSVRANYFQVSDRARPVTATVTGIEFSQAFARIPVTLETEMDFVFRQQLALAFQVGALFVSRATATALTDLASLLRNAVDVRQVARASGAIHSTGGDQFGVAGGLIFHIGSMSRFVIGA